MKNNFCLFKRCCCRDNFFAAAAVFIKTAIPSFCLKPRNIYPTQSNDGS